MPNRSSWFAASALLLAAGVSARAETILLHEVDVEIRGDGSFEQRTKLVVRIDHASDFEAWSPYYVYLDENRTLESFSASSTIPGGKPVALKGKDFDTVAVPGMGELHSSAKYRQATFPPLPVGATISLAYTVRERPYYPAESLSLTLGDAVESLAVTVSGGGAFWRWRIDGSKEGLTIEESPGGLRVRGQKLPAADPPDDALDSAGEGPTLRFAWGEGREWADVGRWYDDLVAPVARNTEDVRREARALVASLATNREKVAALADFVQQKVRYVAVEVGIGGYRPHAPTETLTRKWGDCKDKAFLLIDLLREAGITAYPVLILLSSDDRIDTTFPMPQFNHVIVAVPTSGYESDPADPIADGYLFIDATQTRGGLAWLNSSAQGQDVLVVRDRGGQLVRTPTLPAFDVRTLRVNLTVRSDGSAQGGLGLSIEGGSADYLLDLFATAPPEQIDAALRAVVSRILPGATPAALAHQPGDGPLPRVSISAAIKLESFVQVGTDSRSFSLPHFVSTPSLRALTDRTEPVVLDAGIDEAEWKVHLPADWCPVEADTTTAKKPMGRFEQSVFGEGNTITVKRRTELSSKWVEAADVPALKELALAEQRSAKRRVRLSCTGG